MIFCGLALLLGLVLQSLGQVVVWIAWVFLTCTIEAMRLTAQIPFASVPVRVEGWMVWGHYTLLFGLTRWHKQSKERRHEPRSRLHILFASRVQTKAIVGAAIVLLVPGLFALHALPEWIVAVTVPGESLGDA